MRIERFINWKAIRPAAAIITAADYLASGSPAM